MIKQRLSTKIRCRQTSNNTIRGKFSFTSLVAAMSSCKKGSFLSVLMYTTAFFLLAHVSQDLDVDMYFQVIKDDSFPIYF